MTTKIPSLPSRSLNSLGLEIKRKMAEERLQLEMEIEREGFVNTTYISKNNKLVSLTIESLYLLHNGMISESEKIEAEIKNLLNELIEIFSIDPIKRSNKLSQSIERVILCLLLKNFLLNGSLLSLQDIPFAKDEEYLLGCLSFAQELVKYSTNRACYGDLASINICKELINDLNQLFLQFDFRNGILRRKYDGLKYVLKHLEDISFGLFLSLEKESYKSNELEESFNDNQEMVSKRSKIEEDVRNLSFFSSKVVDCFNQILIRMRTDDQAREEVIKQSRDVQKLSKQAIYSVLRKNYSEASKKIDTACQLSQKIFSIIDNNPLLRPGAFSNSLEELCEGILLYEWCVNKVISRKNEIFEKYNVNLKPMEYIGGISDFTGELGRLAIFYSSDRNFEGVDEIFQIDIVLTELILQLTYSSSSSPSTNSSVQTNTGENTSFHDSKLEKKLETMQNNLKKVENVMYELSLLKRICKN